MRKGKKKWTIAATAATFIFTKNKNSSQTERKKDMRRSEREVTDQAEIAAILQRTQVLHLGLNNGDYPYVVPVNFGFTLEDGALTLFFHGAGEGTKQALLERDPRVAFQLDCGHQLMPSENDEGCYSSYAYESVMGTGVAKEADESEKEELLTQLLTHYGITGKTFDPHILAVTKVYKIKAEQYTAKRRMNDRG